MDREELDASSSSQNVSRQISTIQSGFVGEGNVGHKSPLSGGVFSRITLTDRTTFFILTQTILDLSLTNDVVLTSSQYSQIIWEDSLYRCYESALRFLARREHSRFQLANKLRVRRYKGEQIDKTLDLLESQDYLDDRRFAVTYLLSTVSRRQEGRTMAAMRLASLGVGKSDALAAIEEVYTEEFTLRQVENLLRKQRQTLDRSAILALLKKKGFTQASISAYFDIA